MSNLLAFAAMAEAATGMALVVVPSLVGDLLLGSEITGAGLVVGRVAGLALMALGGACWPGGSYAHASMLGYSTLVALVLAWHGATDRAGIMLWPAVALHAAFSLGLLMTLGRIRRGNTHNSN